MSGRLTDPDFKYTPAAETDLRKTFARVRRELKAAEVTAANLAATGAKLQTALATIDVDGHVITLPPGRKKA